MLREKLNRFMQGRYGTDEFSRFLLAVMIIFWVISMILRIIFPWSRKFYVVWTICNYISYAAVIYCWFRMFSKNIHKRYRENVKYIKYRDKFLNIFKKNAINKDYRIFKCPKCRQKIRVPKNKGKIAISCPKCRTEFIKKT